MSLSQSLGDFNTKVSLSDEAKTDLIWWIENISHSASAPITRHAPDITITTDASLSGWGAIINQTKTYGFWNPQEKLNHINILELRAVLFALLSFSGLIQNKHILVQLDNTVAVAYIKNQGGTKSPQLNSLAKQIWQLVFKFNSWLSVTHISGISNFDADILSRVQSVNKEWQLDKTAFSDIIRVFGQPEIDLFASRINTQRVKFISWHPDPQAFCIDAFTKEFTTSSSRSRENPSDLQTAKFAGLSLLTQHLLSLGLSNLSINLLLSSLRDSTLRQYDVYYRQWIDYVTRRGCDYRNPSAELLVDFLSSLYEKGLSYSAINTARSAISTFSFASPSANIGSDPLVKRLFKGIFENRPPIPKYNDTWDVGIVLRFLKSVEPLHDLSLSDLTKKTLCLMALVSGLRRNVLHQLRIDDMNIFDDHITFLFVKQKPDRPGKPTHPISFFAYPYDKSICVLSCIKEYIRVTAGLRKDNHLFISTKKPHGLASSETLSRWIKDVLFASGVDINRYSSHSTRSASASAAVKTIPINTILQAVGWSCEQTFAKYYYKTVVDHPSKQLANAVLASI
ncbi:uncharacterized protein LOC141909152 [Tubulanus polymorphus]|uniref:uncharacterized protein LOC141909152 n=1 Tax=Tubulanus polymorphus TaxID=672921 RepID=UPI003DA4202B